LVGLVVGSLSFGDSPEARFWGWFQRNSDRLKHFERDQDRIFSELSGELKRINGDLVFAFGPTKGGVREFVVSAGGISSAFPAVKKLVSAAPKMPSWKITAFRPRVGVTDHVIIEGRSVPAADIWYRSLPEGHKLGVVIFVRGYSKATERQLGSAAFLQLDNAIGEYDATTKIGSIAFEDLPVDPRAHGLKPMSALPAEVDRLTIPTKHH